MRKSILRASAALQAVALLGAGATAFIAATPAAAQDYTAGSLTGTVRNAAGAPVAGAAVTLHSVQQGFDRSTTTTSTGTFTFSSLPAGDYDVSVASSGSVPFTATAVQVVAGRSSDIPVVLTATSAANAGTGGAIIVSGRRIQAFGGTTTGLNVDVAELTTRVPVGRSVTSVMLLAPATTVGDSSFNDPESGRSLASVAGSSVAENAFYINGLNITNFDNYLGSAEVPFDFYKSVDIKIGGYPAEFGRATGSIVNAVSKAGTNDFMAAMHLNWAPAWGRADGKDLISCNSAGVCNPSTNRHGDIVKSWSATLEAGGPVFRDRLFLYGLFQAQRTESYLISRTSSLVTHRLNVDPFWAVKVDAFPLDNHHLEFTIFNTRNTTRNEQLSYIENEAGDEWSFGSAQSITDYNFGGVNYVGKYTGRLTDFLTISAAYGRMRDRFDLAGVDAGASLPYFTNVSETTVFGVENGGAYNGQTTSVLDFPYTTERKFYRGDVDIYAHLLGDHHFRVGYDREDNTLNHGATRPGGPYLCGIGYLTSAACALGGGASISFQPDGIAEVNYFISGGAFTARNTAYYAQDEWKPTDRLTLNLGIRRDDFRLNKQDGTVFLESTGNYAPRLGLTYDVWADKRGKFKASYSRYYLPFASNTANRQASAETYFAQQFHYDPDTLDANGLPILLDVITNASGFDQACPFDLTPASAGSGDTCQVTGVGLSPDTSQATDANLKATRESEWMVGYEHRLNGWKVGINYLHRNLDVTAEDSAIDAAARIYCVSQGFSQAVCNHQWYGYNQYVINNPGSDITVALLAPEIPELNGKYVTFKAADLGYPKAKRTYDGIDFVFDHPWNGRWSLTGSYTLSWSKGNIEGGVQSDYGQDDTGITIDFDQPGFTDYAYGYLPNDRRHRLKLFGSYGITDNIILGANYQLSSPRPLSCFGFNPDPNSLENGYGQVSHYCNLQPSPRGTAQHSDWLSTLDLSGRYMVNFGPAKVTLHADVFNVFNSQAVLYRREFGDRAYTGGVITPDSNYGQPRVYQAPRTLRLGMDVEFGGASVPPPPPVEVAPPPPPPPVATQTCPDGSVIAADAACPVPPPPPPPPPAPVERGERGQ